MINQENIYHLLVHGHWTAIINILYRHKEDIFNDASLNHAAITFEQEFFNKVADRPHKDVEISANLDTLYLLHHGKFYQLKDENYKKLILELVKRKPLQEAYNYAQIFPDEEESIEVINKFEKTDVDAVVSMNQYNTTSFSDKKWIEIYNRLFELINEKENTATYFTGPKFINTVREFLPYHPTYEQYIELRNREGKSTSRRIFYYDILFEQSEHTRKQIIERILELVRPFERGKTEKIEALLGIKSEIRNMPFQSDEKQNPVVFISYSWDNEEHKSWVLKLAKVLQYKGVVVILDQYELRLGKNLPHFVEQSIAKAERILIIFTPNYKLKADDRKGGVGYEYSIMNAKLYQAQTKNEKIIPILRAGTMTDSIPDFMQQFIHLDMTNDENYETSLIDLLREIYNEPAIQKPALGNKPEFD